ncbi:MAG: signal recognition particle protein [Thermaurantiacus sp.]
MFDSLSERLGAVFDRLKGRGALTELEVRAAMREVRVALLEADVALPVVKQFVDRATERAIGAEVLKSVTPGQQVVKIVNDVLIETLGSEAADIDLAVAPPAVVMMVGLQGSGKTTTTAKLARLLKEKRGKKVLMASLDVNRPAAQEQLKILGEQVGVPTLPIIPGQIPTDIAKRALQAARLQGFDVLMLDTAGRLHVDEQLMAEMEAVATSAVPAETLLVVDALTGQDAVNVATAFGGRVALSGVILTRMDGDARGGAALSMRQVTGKPIKFIGTGEKLDALEAFHPERAASRILGMGDVVSLVERAADSLDVEDAQKMAEKLEKGGFDMNDMLMQFRQMKRMGGMGMLANLMPGMGKMKQAMADANIDDRAIARLEAIILSMTPKERSKPDIMNARRKIRVAKGSGTQVQDVNKLMKMQAEMANAMKRLKKMGGLGALAQMFTGGGMPGMPGGGADPAALAGGMPQLPPGLMPPGARLPPGMMPPQRGGKKKKR